MECPGGLAGCHSLQCLARAQDLCERIGGQADHLHARAGRALKQPPPFQGANRFAQRRPAHAQFVRKRLLTQLFAWTVAPAEDQLLQLVHNIVCQDACFADLISKYN